MEVRRAKPGVFNCDKCDCDSETHSVGYAKWSIPEIGLDSKVCLRWLVTERSVVLIKAYDHYKNQILPRAGGWLDQSNVLLQVVEIVENHLATSRP